MMEEFEARQRSTPAAMHDVKASNVSEMTSSSVEPSSTSKSFLQVDSTTLFTYSSTSGQCIPASEYSCVGCRSKGKVQSGTQYRYRGEYILEMSDEPYLNTCGRILWPTNHPHQGLSLLHKRARRSRVMKFQWGTKRGGLYTRDESSKVLPRHNIHRGRGTVRMTQGITMAKIYSLDEQRQDRV